MKRSAALFLLLAASAAQAHDIRQHAPHVHGQATVDVALDQQHRPIEYSISYCRSDLYVFVCEE